MSEAFSISFILYYTKALSNQALSLAPDWILLRRPRTPVSLRDSAITFHLEGSSSILQDKVRMLGALVLCSPSKHIFCCTLLTLWCACLNKWNALLCGSAVTSYGLWQKPVGGLYRPANAKRHPTSPSGTDQKWAKRVDRTLLSWSNFQSLWPFHNFLEIRSTNLICHIIDFQGTCDLCCYCVLWLRSQIWIVSKEVPNLVRNWKFRS